MESNPARRPDTDGGLPADGKHNARGRQLELKRLLIGENRKRLGIVDELFSLDAKRAEVANVERRRNGDRGSNKEKKGNK